MGTSDNLKARACERIDDAKEDIFALGDAILHEPELGKKKENSKKGKQDKQKNK
jgi:hypothetical protein